MRITIPKPAEIISAIKKTVSEPLPAAISGSSSSLALIGSVLCGLSIFSLFTSLRGIAPLSIILGLSMICLAYYTRWEVVRTGYEEHVFTVFDYTYLNPIKSLRNPTGVLLVKGNSPEVFHIPISSKREIPPLGWNIRVYIPKGAVPSNYGGRSYYNRVYGYTVEADSSQDSSN